MEAVPFWRKLYLGWMAIVGRFGHAQTLVILTFFYALLIGPVAVVLKLGRSDALGKRGLHEGGSAWLESDSAAPDLERAKMTS